MGATTSTTNPAANAQRIQTLYNRKTLRKIEPKLKLCNYGLSEGYKTIGKTIRFFRPRRANLDGINAATVTLTIVPLITPTAITEGTVPTNITEVAVGYVDITLGQRIGGAKVTDVMSAIDLLDTSEVYTNGLAGDAALDYDTVARNALINGVYNSNGTYANGTLKWGATTATTDGGYFERFSNVPNTGNSQTDFSSLVALTTANGRLTRLGALSCVTQLKNAKIPKIGGNYVAIASPSVTHDIRQQPEWLAAAQFKGDPLYRDLDLMVDGVAYVEANNPWTEGNTYGTESGTDPGNGLIYSTIYLGDQAFGLPSLSNTRAGGTQAAPKITILNDPDKSDWANQLTIFSWKSMFGCGPFIAAGDNTSATNNSIGDVPRYVVMRSKSTFI